MMTISKLPFWVLGLFCCWILVLIWGFLTDIMLILRYKNRRKAYHITVLSICCTAVYLVFQFLTLLIGGSVKPYHQQLVNSFGDVYAILLFAACILCSAEVIIYTVKIYIKYRTRITGSSIKEAVETLPDGICVYEKTDEPPVFREDMVKIGGMSKTSDLRYRGAFNNWKIRLTVTLIDTGVFTMESIINAINLCGCMNGIGEWRMERDGEFGMFHVEVD